MSLLAIAAVILAPMLGSQAETHERAVQPQVEQPAGEPPRSIWRTDVAGTGTHLQSQLVCPATIATFERKRLMPFDAFGFDVGCRYVAPSVGDLTLYLTKRERRSFREQFDAARQALATFNPTAKLIEGAAPAPSNRLAFLGAIYAIDDDLRTGVWAADIAGWTLKLRATYVASKQREALGAMSALVDRIQTSAGAHLAACAAAPAVQRNGTRIADRELITRLALIAGLAAQEGEENVMPLTRSQRWCAEDAIGDAQTPLLLWRNVANPGTDGWLDRVTMMTAEDPPIWLVAGNIAANLLVDKGSQPQPPVIIHELTETRGDTVFMFAFFRGRPGASHLGPLVHDIISGNAKPAGKYNRKTRSVTLPKKAEQTSRKPGALP